MKVDYDIRLGNVRATSQGDGTVGLLSMTCERGMARAGHCVVELAGTSAIPVRAGEQLEVRIDAGEGERLVFTGSVDTVEQRVERTRVTALDPMAALFGLHLARSLPEATPGGLFQDVLAAAAIPPGRVDPGPALVRVVVHPDSPVLTQLRALADLFGADVFCDGMGRVHLQTPRTGDPNFRFEHGAHLVDIDLRVTPDVHDGVTVWGEGAAGTRGPERGHWLAVDLEPCRGGAAWDSLGRVWVGKLGTRPLVVRSGLIRSRKAAEIAAAGQAEQRASRTVRGSATVLGRPGVEPGQLVRLDDLPEPRWAGLRPYLDTRPLRVRSVRHHLEPRAGFLTRLGF